jgi:hypothetical protein
MKRKLNFLLLLIPLVSTGQPDFYEYFLKKTLRFDFILGGNANDIKIYPVELKQEPFWAGSLINLTDTFNYGSYRFRVYDSVTGKLIYSKGFSTLFQEWQTTPEAKVNDKSFYHCLLFPFPLKPVKLEIDVRKRQENFIPLFSMEIDPDDYFILKENTFPYETRILMENGNMENKVDLVILAEGYKKEEMEKFLADARRVLGYLFDEEPFKSAKDNFNVRAVLTPSIDSGTDVPGKGIYRNTVFNSTFYTFDIDRYLTTDDMKAIHDAAANVPYDHIYVLVNSDLYGGGGIYNFLNICTADNHLTREVFVHEFGHGFAGLGDEYYSSEVAYESFYNTSVEPWEPNLTTLVNFPLKWESIIHDSVPVPTPRNENYLNVTGVFEGGGYQAKGIYSPYMDCRMKSNEAEGFCPVCSDAVNRVIDFYCK